ncbi:MAG: prepilin-type N-terminal cleavage/methylation domain-containing protein [Burkholderiales bacterium]|nr:prepilin-type N-terminal cleavage/methylation domain-containing protein [Burkholderiales bacterium]
MARRRTAADGFSLIELLAVLVVIAVLAVVLLRQAVWYQERAERAAMESTIAVLRSALQMQVAGRIAAGRDAQLSALATENPMNWLARKPKSYAGAYEPAGAPHVPAGRWYFDVADRQLVYRPRHRRYLTASDRGEMTELRFRTVLDVGPGRGHGGVDGVGEMDIRVVRAYSWAEDAD